MHGLLRVVVMMDCLSVVPVACVDYWMHVWWLIHLPFCVSMLQLYMYIAIGHCWIAVDIYWSSKRLFRSGKNVTERSVPFRRIMTPLLVLDTFYLHWYLKDTYIVCSYLTMYQLFISELHADYIHQLFCSIILVLFLVPILFWWFN